MSESVPVVKGELVKVDKRKFKPNFELNRLQVSKPGKFGGRPKGARNKLGEKFLRALHDDFAKHGAEAVVQCRKADPVAYCRIVATLIPAQLDVNFQHQELFGDVTPEEMSERDLEAYANRLLENISREIAGRRERDRVRIKAPRGSAGSDGEA